MAKFILSTDSSCDVCSYQLKALNIKSLPLYFTINGRVFPDVFEQDSEYEEFYKKIEEGAMPSTSQINTYTHEEYFDDILENSKCNVIVHLSLSSGLSGTYNNAIKAAKNSMIKFPQSQIYVIDTKGATQAHHYVLDEALKCRDENISGADTFVYLNESIQQMNVWFAVDDLMHLKRGGRINGVTAVIGTMLNIKPILIINNEGKLAVVQKVKGYNKVFNEFIKKIKENAIDPEHQTYYIASANATEYAPKLKKLILDTFPQATVKIGWIGPVIGSHTGPNAVGLVFKAKQRLTNK